MNVMVGKSVIRGGVIAPPSKSYTIRGLFCAALAEGESLIINPLDSDDTAAAVSVLRQAGIVIEKGTDGLRVCGGRFRQPESELFCRDSAATFRFMTAVSSLVPGVCRLTSGASLSKRPVRPLLDALSQLGVGCRMEDGVVVVRGGGLEGGKATLPGDISSQYVSALLLAAPLASRGAEISLSTPPSSKPYIDMTLETMQRFGVAVKTSDDRTYYEVARQHYSPAAFRVEGDWSSAAYFLALGALAGEIKVTELDPGSMQADRIVLKFLQDMGADLTVGKDSVAVRKSCLGAIEADLSDCIDLLPTMAVLAAAARGTSRFRGIGRARLKESDRVAAVSEGLRRLGVPVSFEKDSIAITGAEIKGAIVDSFGDHRIAMAFGVLGAVAGDIIIKDAGCVSKTYPDFWQVFEGVGGRIERYVE